MRKMSWVAKVFMAGLLCLISWDVSLAANGRIFSDLDKSTDVRVLSEEKQKDPTVVRSRLVEVDLRQLVHGERRSKKVRGLILNLFEDASFIIRNERLTKRGPNRYTWVGRIQGQEYSHVILVLEAGYMVGNMSTDDGRTFQVRYMGNRIHSIREIDPSAAPPKDVHDALAGESRPVGSSKIMAQSLPQAAAAADPDSGSVIDIMVVYAPDAAVTPGIEGEIVLAVETANSTFEDSGVLHRLRLVHTALVNDPKPSTNPAVTLAQLVSPDDGYMDEVHTLRGRFGADIVSLWVERPRHEGWSWQMEELSPAQESMALNVVGRKNANGADYNFTHEIGHLMGAGHDWYALLEALNYDNGLIGKPFMHNFGYVDQVDHAWRTIMSYPNECESVTGQKCFTIPRWSNSDPEVTYQGKPLGVPLDQKFAADNILVLNQTGPIVASYREAIVPMVPPEGGMGGSQINALDNVDDVSGPQIAMDGLGRAVAVWVQGGGIWANQFIPPDTDWGTAASISIGNNAGVASEPQVAMDETGNALAVWEQGGEIRANQFTPATGWGTAASIGNSAAAASNPKVVMDGTGNGLAVWEQEERIWARSCTAGSWAGSSPQPIDVNSGGGTRPQVAMGANGNALAVWEHGGHVWTRAYTVTGWEDPAPAKFIDEPSGTDATNPQVAMDPSGNAIVVWHYNGTWARYYDVDTGWSDFEYFAEGASTALAAPKVAMSVNGSALVAWEAGPFTYVQHYVKGKDWLGGSSFQNASSPVVGSSQVVIDSDGDALVVWEESGHIWFNRYLTSKGWSGPDLFEQGVAETEGSPQIVTDPTGNAMVVNRRGANMIWANRVSTFLDWDQDGVINQTDNCVMIPNETQVDVDGDGIGDACDNCLEDPNPGQANFDLDELGNVCDSDLDGDGVANHLDNCAMAPNPDQADTDQDGVGDVCDNCPGEPNSDQSNMDKDLHGDVCDNCAGGGYGNNLQLDTDGDLLGDVCDDDDDNDGVLDDFDNCPTLFNPGQIDVNGNGVGDCCEQGDVDTDGDGSNDLCDNCPGTPNPDQADCDGVGGGDVCDASPCNTDTDGDGVIDDVDNCWNHANPDQADCDMDGIGDACAPPHYLDSDGDSYGDPNVASQACPPPSGYVSSNRDCDDTRASVFPGAAETCAGPALDTDCDGLIHGGGGRWGRPEFIETNNVMDVVAPQVALDEAGNAVAVWVQAPRNAYGTPIVSDVVANRYDVATSAWEGPLLMEEATPWANHPQIVLDGSGNGMVVWDQDFRVWARKYISGEGWEDFSLTPISPQGSIWDRSGNPHVAMNSVGNAFAVWTQITWGEVVPKGGIWSSWYGYDSATQSWDWHAAEPIGGEDYAAKSDPRVAIDAMGNAVAIWGGQVTQSSWHVWANQLIAPPGSPGWDPNAAALMESNQGDAGSHQIAMNEAGDHMVVWEQGGRIYALPMSWRPIDNGSMGSASDPQVAMDPSGNGLAVWAQGGDIWADQYVAGLGWGRPPSEPIVFNPQAAESPQVAVDDNGNAIAVWVQEDPDGLRKSIWSSRYVAAWGEWETPALLETSNGDAADPQIAMNASGRAIAVWKQKDPQDPADLWNVMASMYWPPVSYDCDQDQVTELADNCPDVFNPDQADMDGDGKGDLCEDDDVDLDGIRNDGDYSGISGDNPCTPGATTGCDDNCPNVANAEQADFNGNGMGDACEDSDRDGVVDAVDNCPIEFNPNQSDQDQDSLGDFCDPCTDSDMDGYGDPGYSTYSCGIDNCPRVYNPDQADCDGNGIGVACEPDPPCFPLSSVTMIEQGVSTYLLTIGPGSTFEMPLFTSGPMDIYPGKDGGVLVGQYQPHQVFPNAPTMGSDLIVDPYQFIFTIDPNNPLIHPSPFVNGLPVYVSTNPVDPVDGVTSYPPPSIYYGKNYDRENGNTLFGFVQSWDCYWKSDHFNQGAPKDNTASAMPNDLAATGELTPGTIAGTTDYILVWYSLIAGGPFHGFGGEWILSGQLVVTATCEKGVIDTDGDGVCDRSNNAALDNCVGHFNPNQADLDGDGLGDICDLDEDGDGFDGYTKTANVGRDCEDRDASINPNAQEVCGNRIDENCDFLLCP